MVHPDTRLIDTIEPLVNYFHHFMLHCSMVHHFREASPAAGSTWGAYCAQCSTSIQRVLR